MTEITLKNLNRWARIRQKSLFFRANAHFSLFFPDNSSLITDSPDLRDRLLLMLAAELRISLDTSGATATLEEEIAPERVGAYRIAERIGRGGMGSVYRGECDTGDFSHVVAIKGIKPGLLSSALVERFTRERQILASLSHPNIAQLYDGCETSDGSPYIVMEMVTVAPVSPLLTEIWWSTATSPLPIRW